MQALLWAGVLVVGTLSLVIGPVPLAWYWHLSHLASPSTSEREFIPLFVTGSCAIATFFFGIFALGILLCPEENIEQVRRFFRSVAPVATPIGFPFALVGLAAAGMKVCGRTFRLSFAEDLGTRTERLLVRLGIAW
jgi:hypothetical protein